MRPIVSRGSGSQLVEWRPGVCTRLHASGEVEPASLCMLEQWCEPGCGAPTHTHMESEEIVTVIAGSAEFWVDGETTGLASGDSILLPAHSWHGFRNTGASTLRLLAVFASARPRARYEHEPATVVEFAARGGTLIDAHRAVHRDESA